MVKLKKFKQKLNKKGAVLLVVVFSLLFIVGMAAAFSVVSITSYKNSIRKVNKEESEIQAKNTAEVIANNFLSTNSITRTEILNNLNILKSQKDKQARISATYTTDTGLVGDVVYYYPSDTTDTVHLTVTTNVKGMVSSATIVLKGQKPNTANELNNYNLYVTDPENFNVNDPFVFNNIKIPLNNANVEETLTMFISAYNPVDSPIKNQMIIEGQFPQENTNGLINIIGNQLTIKGKGWKDTSTKINASINSFCDLTLSNIRCYSPIITRSIRLSCTKVEGSIDSGGKTYINGNYVSGDTVKGNIKSLLDVYVLNANVAGNIDTLDFVRIYSSNVRNINARKEVKLYSNSSCNSIVSNKYVEIKGSVVKGDIHATGDVIIENSKVEGSIYTTGNVIITNSTILGDVKTTKDLTIKGSDASTIEGNVTIKGAIKTSQLSGNKKHIFGKDNVDTFLKINGTTGQYETGVEYVILKSVNIKGKLVTPHKVAFSDNVNNPNIPSKINKFYSYNDIELKTGPFDLENIEIEHLNLINGVNGNLQNANIINGIVNNIYGNSIILDSVRQSKANSLYEVHDIQLYNTMKLNLTNNFVVFNGNIKAVLENTNPIVTYNVTIGPFVNFSPNSEIIALGGMIVQPKAVPNDENDNIDRYGKFFISKHNVIQNNIGSLYLNSGATINNGIVDNTLGSNSDATTIKVNGDFINNNSAKLTISKNVTINGKLKSKGSIDFYGNVKQDFIIDGKINLKSGASIGTENQDYIFQCISMVDEGGATVYNKTVLNNENDNHDLIINSNYQNDIFSYQKTTISNDYCNDKVKGNIRIIGISTGENLVIYRGVKGSIQSEGDITIKSDSTEIEIEGNIKANNCNLNNVHVFGDVELYTTEGTLEIETTKLDGKIKAKIDIIISDNCELGKELPDSNNENYAIFTEKDVFVGNSVNINGNIVCNTFKSKYESNPTSYKGALKVAGFIKCSDLFDLSNFTSSIDDEKKIQIDGIIAENNITFKDSNANGKNTFAFLQSVNGDIIIINAVINDFVTSTSDNLNKIELTNCTAKGNVSGPKIKLVNTHVVKNVKFKNSFDHDANSPIDKSLWGKGSFEFSSDDTEYAIIINAQIKGDIKLENWDNTTKKFLKINADVGTDSNGGSIYANGLINVVENHKIYGSIESTNTINIGKNCTVKGNIVSTLESNKKTVDLSEDCSVGSIKANGNIFISQNCEKVGDIDTTKKLISYSSVGSINAKEIEFKKEYKDGENTVTSDKNINIKGNLNYNPDDKNKKLTIYGTITGILKSSVSVVFEPIEANTVIKPQYLTKDKYGNIVSTSKGVLYCTKDLDLTSSNIKEVICDIHCGDMTKYKDGNLKIGNDKKNINITGNLNCRYLTIYGNVNGNLKCIKKFDIYGNITGDLFSLGYQDVVNHVNGSMFKSVYVKKGNIEVDGGNTKGIYIGKDLNTSFVLECGYLKINNVRNSTINSSIIVNQLLVNYQGNYNDKGKLITGSYYTTSIPGRNDLKGIRVHYDKYLTSSDFANKTAGNIVFKNNIKTISEAFVEGCTFDKYESDLLRGCSLQVEGSLFALNCKFYGYEYKVKDEDKNKDSVLSNNLSSCAFTVGYSGHDEDNFGNGGSAYLKGCEIFNRSQVCGDLVLVDSSVAGSAAGSEGNSRMNTTIGRDLIMYNSQFRSNEFCYLDTMVVVKRHCTMEKSQIGGYKNFGKWSWGKRNGWNETFEGLWCNQLYMFDNSYIEQDTFCRVLYGDGTSTIHIGNNWDNGYLDVWDDFGGYTRKVNNYKKNSGLLVRSNFDDVYNYNWCMACKNTKDGIKLMYIKPNLIGENSISVNKPVDDTFKISINANDIVFVDDASFTNTFEPNVKSVNSIDDIDIVNLVNNNLTNITYTANNLQQISMGEMNVTVGNITLTLTEPQNKPVDAYKPRTPGEVANNTSLNSIDLADTYTDHFVSDFVTNNWGCSSEWETEYGHHVDKIWVPAYYKHCYIIQNNNRNVGQIPAFRDPKGNPKGIQAAGFPNNRPVDGVAIFFRTWYYENGVKKDEDLHVIIPKGYFWRFGRDENSGVYVEGNSNVYLYYMGDNEIDMRGAWDDSFRNDFGLTSKIKAWRNNGEKGTMPDPQLFLMGVGSNINFKFYNINMYASIYLPDNVDSSHKDDRNRPVADTINSVSITTTDWKEATMSGCIVANKINVKGWKKSYSFKKYNIPNHVMIDGQNYRFMDLLNAEKFQNTAYDWNIDSLIVD